MKAIARERVGRIPAAKTIQPKWQRKKPKYTAAGGGGGGAVMAPRLTALLLERYSRKVHLPGKPVPIV
ncbi:MAG: hypothetical protein WDO73_12495 [Ignavibacteriota bacterium]